MKTLRMKTFQDFEQAADRLQFVLEAIREHRASSKYETARIADLYDRQLNETIYNYAKMIYTLNGSQINDFTSSNNKIASNFFNRLNTQRCMYSLGNGISFIDVGEHGEDTTKEILGRDFDHDLQNWAYYALKHGVSFGFWNIDRLYVFPLTEFVPLWDEYNGTLRAGIRFWQIDYDRPMIAVLYEEDGYTKFCTEGEDNERLVILEEKRNYIEKVSYIEADGFEQIIGGENYSKLPIVPMWGSRLKQSTLVGMRESIDAYDLIRSGFANDLTDCAEIYWIVQNCGGMDDNDLAQFRDRLKLNHIAATDSDDGGSATPYTQEIPYQARKQFLEDMRAGIYEDFGALDVHTVAAGATNDHIDAAYQPLDENAADFEYQVTEAVRQLLSLMGIDDSPVYNRNRISNIKEQVEIVMMEANYLDQQTVLRKLPNITPEEVQAILDGIDSEDQGRLISGFLTQKQEEPIEE